MNFLIPLIFTIVAVAIFVVSLHFSRYKKRKSGCCSGHHLTVDKAEMENAKGSCDFDPSRTTCCQDETKKCTC